MYKFSCLILLSFFLSLNTQAKNCVDGRWFFDKDDSDNLEKLTKKLFKNVDIKLKAKNLGVPVFVLSSADLLIQRQEDGVHIQWDDSDGNTYQRHFSTIGKTKSVSLKYMNSGANTVVASWEEHSLVVETTTPQGVYIEEIFTLETFKDKSQKLSIQNRLANRVGMQLNFEKVYLQKNSDWLACLQAEESLLH